MNTAGNTVTEIDPTCLPCLGPTTGCGTQMDSSWTTLEASEGSAGSLRQAGTGRGPLLAMYRACAGDSGMLGSK